MLRRRPKAPRETRPDDSAVSKHEAACILRDAMRASRLLPTCELKTDVG